MALTEDAGALALREAAEQLGMVEPLRELWDAREPALVTYPMAELVLTRVLMIAQGWGDQDDADALRSDPALRVAVSLRRGTRPLDSPRGREPTGLASQPTLSRLTDTLAVGANLAKMRALLRNVGVARLRDHGVTEEVVLDVDSLPLIAHSRQEGAAYNGHYHDTVLHPLAVFAHTGDLLAFEQRAGNVHTADNVREILAPVLDAVAPLAKTVWVRVDAGFAAGHFFDWPRRADGRRAVSSSTSGARPEGRHPSRQARSASGVPGQRSEGGGMAAAPASPCATRRVSFGGLYRQLAGHASPSPPEPILGAVVAGKREVRTEIGVRSEQPVLADSTWLTIAEWAHRAIGVAGVITSG